MYQQAKERVSDYWLCYSWWPKYSHQRTGKNWLVPGIKNRITESLECQGSGHIGSYRCSCNYFQENTSLYKTDWYPADIVSIQKTDIIGTVYILQRVPRHLRNWVDFKCLV